jgi:hypothetical protein
MLTWQAVRGTAGYVCAMSAPLRENYTPDARLEASFVTLKMFPLAASLETKSVTKLLLK